jgi:NADPH-ferrihemoprotein reductase
MCRVFVRESTFKLPEDISLPVIMIGPGTGIAPMRAFLQEIKWRRDTYGSSKVGEADLYFGCRRFNEDYIYEEELLDYCKNDTLSRLEVAFSRDGPAKKYVQHLMIESKERLWDLISNKGAHVYVCGGTNMGKQVRDAFEDIISDLGDMTGDEATKYVKNMQDVRPQRYTQELWS